MDKTVTLAMGDGVKVVVPDSLNLLTPYVLLEQQDWFEDEIGFVRRLLRPGQNVVDIGANYGLYALSMARAVGQSGRVWAFEPASATASLLGQSVLANDFDHVTVEPYAVSEAEGTAQLTMHGHAECNALVRDAAPAQATETVRLVTLDSYAEDHDWPQIDFIKIDAEGEEVNILRGGEGFFSRNSPLVQYEIKAGPDLNLDLVQACADMGYESYRLVPGLDVLVPFQADQEVDPYLLNVFACKPDRAAELEANGRLIREWLERDAPDGLLHGPECGLPDWRAVLTSFPYGQKMAAQWEAHAAGDDAAEIGEALGCFVLSRDLSRPVAERFHALTCSYRLFGRLAETQPTHARLSSLARVARDYGARAVAVEALGRLCASLASGERVEASEPFLPPSMHADFVDPGDEPGEWLLVISAGEMERLQEYSSFYRGLAARDRLEMICRSKFAGLDMRRRLSLLQHRFGLVQAAPPG